MLINIIVILDNTVYLHDSSECVDDINTMYNDFETKVSQVIDHHAPIKYRYPRKKLSTVYEQSWEKLYTKNKCYDRNLRNTKQIKPGKHTENKEILLPN